MKNQEHQVRLEIKEAIELVQNDYTELNNIRPADFTKEEYEQICNNAIEVNSLALQYVEPRYLLKNPQTQDLKDHEKEDEKDKSDGNESDYKQICINAMQNLIDFTVVPENAWEKEFARLLNCVKKEYLTPKYYLDVCINLVTSITDNDYDDIFIDENTFIFLNIIDNTKIDHLGKSLYIELCLEAIKLDKKNLSKVKSNILQDNEYYELCKEILSHDDHALLYVKVDKLTTQQLYELVLICFKDQDWVDHPLSYYVDDEDDEYCDSDIGSYYNNNNLGCNYFLNYNLQYGKIYKKLKGDYYYNICKQEVTKHYQIFEDVKKSLLNRTGRLYECGELFEDSSLFDDSELSEDSEFPTDKARYKELALIAVENYQNNKPDHPLKIIQAKDFIKEDYKDICIKAVTKYPESLQFVDRTKFSKETYEQIEILAKNSKKILDEQDSNDITNKAASIEKDLKDGFKIPFNATTLNQDNDEDTGAVKKQQVTENNIMQLKQVDIEHDDSSAMGQYNDIDH